MSPLISVITTAEPKKVEYVRLSLTRNVGFKMPGIILNIVVKNSSENTNQKSYF